MRIGIQFAPHLFVIGFAYVPGYALGIHIPGFALILRFGDEDDDDDGGDDGGELRPIEDAA